MRIYRKENLGKGDHGWLKSNFHFSFSDYFNKERMGYGKLRVVNDDTVQAGTGFNTHPHRDMEIISYVFHGELTHKDSMGTKETLYPGEIQYMSAGTGISHSEFNEGDDILRFLQIWILPDKENHKPNYGSKRIPMEERHDKWFHFVSPINGSGLIGINQDANIYASIISEGKQFNFPLSEGRQLYGILIDGELSVESELLKSGDGFDSNESLTFNADKKSHILIIEIKKSL
ncbi:MAG: pirin family protein [Spirochaetaceae bacterium]|jgi:redox-sensitive bicupin YhaK (pirin superfamily)|nr:pirin family protein [Spirochaetaceae bacterium]